MEAARIKVETLMAAYKIRIKGRRGGRKESTKELYNQRPVGVLPFFVLIIDIPSLLYCYGQCLFVCLFVLITPLL